MNPATRFLSLGVAAVLLLTVAAAAVTLQQADRRARGASLAPLRVAITLERELQANQLAELQLRADALAQDPAFVDYVAQSLIPNPQLGGAVDKASISDLLKERRRGYDIAVVLDAQGAPVAASGILLREPGSIQRDPLVVSAISQLTSRQGLWIDDGQLLWIAVSPLLRGGALQGVLLVGSHVDDAFAATIGRIAHVDVALFVAPAAGAGQPSSSGLDHWTGQALSARLPEVLGVTEKAGKAMPLADGQRSATAWVAPMDASGGKVALVAISPDDGGGVGDATTWPLLAVVCGFGVCMLLLVLLQWWRTWLPLQRMLDVVELARHGDQHLTLRVDGSAIVRRLREGINPLLHRGR
jgi:hypothetical protein